MADPEHHVAGIVAPLPLAPTLDLRCEIGRGLAGEWRVGGANALPLLAVTCRTGRNAALRIADMIQPKGGGRCTAHRFGRLARVMEGDRLALGLAELPGDPRHLRVIPAAVGIRVQLTFEIAGVEAGEPRRSSPVPAPVEAVAGEAGIDCTCIGAAQGDQLPVGCETVERGRVGVRAASDQRCQRYRKDVAHPAATIRRAGLFRALVVTPLLVLAAACKGPPEQSHSLPGADPANGRAAIQRLGCASCHRIAGIDWPRGTVGPRLEGLASRGLIAGRLPNRPDVLSAYIRNAPALVPGSGMPAMPVSRADARDIVAYLYAQEGR